MPAHYKNNIKDVTSEHGDAVPQSQEAICHHGVQKYQRDHEKQNIANKEGSDYMERFH